MIWVNVHPIPPIIFVKKSTSEKSTLGIKYSPKTEGSLKTTLSFGSKIYCEHEGNVLCNVSRQEINLPN